MPPVPNELHIDRYLTNLSVAYAQDSRDFISDKVFPVVPVRKQSDKYVIYNRGDMWRQGNVHERPLGGRLDVADWSFTEGTYFCTERGLAHKIDDRQYANADEPIDLRRQAMELLTSSVMIDAEAEWTAKYFGTGIWTNDVTGAASADFVTSSTPSTGYPLEVIDEFKESTKRLTALTPNTLILSAISYRVIRNHETVKDVFKYTRPGLIDEELLAMAFGVDSLFIPRGVENSAVEGAADSLDFIAVGQDHNAMLLYAAPRPGLNTPSAGYTFAWTGLIPGATNPMGGVIMTGRDAFAHSDHFEIRQANDMRVVSPDLGVHLTEFTA